MHRSRRWLHPVVGVAVVAVLLWRFGPAPVADALRRIDAWSLAAAAAIGLLTTVSTSWRWVLVARGLGLRLSLLDAFLASYRSQFLNVSLPAGIVGDVHRGVVHGRDTGQPVRAVRAVVLERFAGQALQVCLAILSLLVVPSPVRGPALRVGVMLALAAAALIVVALVIQRAGSLGRRLIRGAGAEVRGGILHRRTWPGVIAASVVAIAGHVGTFLLAARQAGPVASPWALVPVAFIVLLAMGIPLNLAGWGPREGAAAWAFGAAGLSVSQGLTTAVIYGGMVIVASLPGAAILTFTRRRRCPPEAGR